jgi:hypothetical protein
MYEVIISNHSDASSGVYDTKLEAMDAVDEAAALEGLTARYGHTTNAGCFVDKQGLAWFHFEIREYTPEQYVLLALDSGDTEIVSGWHRLTMFAADRDMFVDGAFIRDNTTQTAMYSTVVLPA